MSDGRRESHDNVKTSDHGTERAAMSHAASAYSPGQRPEMAKGADSSSGALPKASVDAGGINFGPSDAKSDGSRMAGSNGKAGSDASNKSSQSDASGNNSKGDASGNNKQNDASGNNSKSDSSGNNNSKG